jgi:LNS2 (Lipin/Ned1/Smp2)
MGRDDDSNNRQNEKASLASEDSSSEATARTAMTSCGGTSSFASLVSSFDDCGLFPSSVLIGNAWDLIVTHSSRDATLVASSDAVYCFDKHHGIKLVTPHARSVVLEIETLSGSPLRFPIRNHKIQSPGDSLYPMEERRVKSLGFLGFSSSSSSSSSSSQSSGESHSPLALSTIVESIKPGRNRARYLLLHDDEVLAVAPMSIFSWTDQERVIVVDVDGTITKSNVRGMVDTVLTESYHHCHSGVCRFFSTLLSQLETNEILRARLVYLSSRPIKLANCTKKFIHELRQKGDSALPDGPLLCFPGSLSKVLKMELVYHSVHEFKLKTLRDQVVRPFVQVGVTDNVLLAGFGNQASDMKAYHKAGCDKIYLIDKQSKIYSLDRELHLRDTSPPRHPSLAPSHSHHHNHNHHAGAADDEEHLRSKGLSFEGYSDANLIDHISHNPHFTHYQDFFC